MAKLDEVIVKAGSEEGDEAIGRRRSGARESDGTSWPEVGDEGELCGGVEGADEAVSSNNIKAKLQAQLHSLSASRSRRTQDVDEKSEVGASPIATLHVVYCSTSLGYATLHLVYCSPPRFPPSPCLSPIGL